MLSLVSMSLRRFRCAPPVLALVLALSAARAESDSIGSTLPEDYLPGLKTILQTALSQSPPVLAKEIDIALNEARVLGVDAQRLPSLSSHLDYARNQTAISGNSGTQTNDSGFFYGIDLNQPVFHWGALKNQSDAARISVMVAEKNYQEMKRLIAIELRQRYLALIAKKAVLQQGRFALGLAAADLALAREKLAEGDARPNAVASQQMGFDEASLRLERDEAEFAGSRRSFARLAGLEDLAEDAIPVEIAKPANPAAAATELLATFLRSGAKSAFQTEIYELLVHQDDLSYQVARVRQLPKFNARASYGLENTTNATPTSVLQQGVARQTVLLNTQWNIFDGFATRGAKHEALANKRLHERELQTSVDEALDKAQALQRALSLDARAMELTELRRQQSADDLAQVKENLGLGNTSKRAVADAQSNLYASEANNCAARATFLGHWAEFVSLAGTDPVLNFVPVQHAREKR